MGKKIMGIVAGRKGGNSEILVKEALLAAQEEGAECTLINLNDFTIKHCSGCESCTMAMAKGIDAGCIYDGQDDAKEIMDFMLHQDGFIFGVPTYDLMPCSRYLAFSQRFMSYVLAFKYHTGAIDHIPDRVCGLIAVGGSTRSWQSMSLECLQASTFMQSVQVVDQMMAMKVGRPGHVTLYPDFIERARKMGKNVVASLDVPQEERGWYGDEGYGWCPICHSNAVQLGNPQWDGVEFPVECCVCGTGGTIELSENGKYKFIPDPEKGTRKNRTTPEGEAEHMDEIKVQQHDFFSQEETAKERMKKYRELKYPGIR